jgi:hypothetical protein
MNQKINIAAAKVSLSYFQGDLYRVYGEDGPLHCAETIITAKFNGAEYWLKHSIPGHYEIDEGEYGVTVVPNYQYRQDADKLIDKIEARGVIDLQHWIEHRAPSLQERLAEAIHAENEDRQFHGAPLLGSPHYA